MKYVVFGDTGLRASLVALGTGAFGTGCVSAVVQPE